QMPYNRLASQADRFNSPTCRLESSGSRARFLSFLATPAPILESAAKSSLMTYETNDKRQTCGRQFALLLRLAGCKRNERSRTARFASPLAGGRRRPLRRRRFPWRLERG